MSPVTLSTVHPHICHYFTLFTLNTCPQPALQASYLYIVMFLVLFGSLGPLASGSAVTCEIEEWPSHSLSPMTLWVWAAGDPFRGTSFSFYYMWINFSNSTHHLCSESFLPAQWSLKCLNILVMPQHVHFMLCGNIYNKWMVFFIFIVDQFDTKYTQSRGSAL